MPGEAENPKKAAQRAGVILLVEDDVLVRGALAEYLRGENYEVLEAHEANEAMTVLNAEHVVDLVLTDVQMPGPPDGLELVRWLKEHFPDIPAIVTSGGTSRSNIGTVVPPMQILMKPYRVGELRALIAALLKTDDI
jgi:DNA-binding response OmpR family regulator